MFLGYIIKSFLIYHLKLFFVSNLITCHAKGKFGWPCPCKENIEFAKV